MVEDSEEPLADVGHDQRGSRVHTPQKDLLPVRLRPRNHSGLVNEN